MCHLMVVVYIMDLVLFPFWGGGGGGGRQVNPIYYFGFELNLYWFDPCFKMVESIAHTKKVYISSRTHFDSLISIPKHFSVP